MFKIIHNPRCSKSRQTLALLQEHTDKVEVILYLEGELDEATLRKAIKGLKLSPSELLRTKEDEFKALKLDTANDEKVIKAILKHPKILERPIVIHGAKAVIGRPPENVNLLLK
ncbi:MAG: arsenate reductase (glutaredoxin) [Halobacteriovorax sp.]|nr:arsenate reductase (glutaredoxin) [Halobacteriovorax sp.]